MKTKAKPSKPPSKLAVENIDEIFQNLIKHDDSLLDCLRNLNENLEYMQAKLTALNGKIYGEKMMEEPDTKSQLSSCTSISSHVVYGKMLSNELCTHLEKMLEQM